MKGDGRLNNLRQAEKKAIYIFLNIKESIMISDKHKTERSPVFVVL